MIAADQVTFPFTCPACGVTLASAVLFRAHFRSNTRDSCSPENMDGHLALIVVYGETFCRGKVRTPRKSKDTLTEPNACTINPAELLEIDVTAMSTMKFPGRCPAKNCRSICKSPDNFASHIRAALYETAAQTTQRNHHLLVPKLPAGFPLKAVKEFQIALGSPSIGLRLVKSVMESHSTSVMESRNAIVDVQKEALDRRCFPGAGSAIIL